MILTALRMLYLLTLLHTVLWLRCPLAAQLPWRTVEPNISSDRPVTGSYLDPDPALDLDCLEPHGGIDFATHIGTDGYDLFAMEPGQIVHCKDDGGGEHGDTSYNFLIFRSTVTGKYIGLANIDANSITPHLRTLTGNPECECSFNDGQPQDPLNITVDADHLDTVLGHCDGDLGHMHLGVGVDDTLLDTGIFSGYYWTKHPFEVYPILKTMQDNTPPVIIPYSEGPMVDGVLWPEVLYTGTPNPVYFIAYDWVSSENQYLLPGLIPICAGYPNPNGPLWEDGCYLTGIHRAEIHDLTGVGSGYWELLRGDDLPPGLYSHYGQHDVLVCRVDLEILPGPSERYLELTVSDYDGNSDVRCTDQPVGDDVYVGNVTAAGQGASVELAWSSNAEPGYWFYYGVSTDGGVSYEDFMGIVPVPGETEYDDELSAPEYPIDYQFGYVFRVGYAHPDYPESGPAAIAPGSLEALPLPGTPPSGVPAGVVTQIGPGTVTLEVVNGAQWAESYACEWTGEGGAGSSATIPPSLCLQATDLIDGEPIEVRLCGLNGCGQGPWSGWIATESAGYPELVAFNFDGDAATVVCDTAPGGLQYRLRYRKLMPDVEPPIDTAWETVPEWTFSASGGELYSVSFMTRNMYGQESSWSEPEEYWTTDPTSVDGSCSELATFGVWPSITRDRVRLSYASVVGEEIYLQMFDVSGRLLGQERRVSGGPGEVSLQVTLHDFAGRHLDPGVYFIRLLGTRQSHWRRVLVVQ